MFSQNRVLLWESIAVTCIPGESDFWCPDVILHYSAHKITRRTGTKDLSR